MWFDSKPIKVKSRRTRSSRKRVGTITLNARGAGRKKSAKASRTPKLTKVAVGALALITLVAVGAAVWYGSRTAARRLFTRNHVFVIKHIDIRGGVMMSKALVREYARVDEGMNLFDLNIGQIRNDFIRRAPSVKQMEISRVLPDTLRLEIVERMPLARLGRRGPLVVGRHGMIFVYKGPMAQLPIIAGYGRTGTRPGLKLTGMAQAALEVLDAIDEHPALDMEVETVDVGNRDCLVLRLADRKSVKLAWREMGMLTPASRQHLMKKLAEVSAALQSERGMHLSMLNATLDDGRMHGN